MEPRVKRLIALVILNIILLAIFLSKNKDKEPAIVIAPTEQNTVNSSLESETLDHKGQSYGSSNTKATTQASRASQNKSESSAKTDPTPQVRRTLSNGSQPYAAWYGYNQRYTSESPQSTIQVTSAVSQDVIVIVKYDNQDGAVAGHIYIQAGKTGKIYVTPGYWYQVFFYYGDDWDENKQMPGGVRGGFTRNEQADKDPKPQHFSLTETYDGITWDGGVEYNLNPVRNGNFSTKKCSTSEVF